MSTPLRPSIVALIESLARLAVQEYLTAQAEARQAFSAERSNPPGLPASALPA